MPEEEDKKTSADDEDSAGPRDEQNDGPEAGEEGTSSQTQDAGKPAIEPGELPQKSRLPDELPVMPFEHNVAFPVLVLPLQVQDEQRLKLVEQVILGNKLFVAVTAKKELSAPALPDELYQVGTTCVILQMLRMPDGSVRLLAQGLVRCRIDYYVKTEPYLQARVRHLGDEESDDVESTALFKNLRGQFLQMVDRLPHIGEEVKIAVSNIEEPGQLADFIASHLNLAEEEKQQVLETLDVKERLKAVTRLLAREMEFMEVAQKIQSQARSEIDKGQREYYLRQQLKAIQEELGERDSQAGEVQELRELIEKKNLPPEALKECERELNRLERMNPASPEYTVSRTYLSWIVDLPWNETTPDNMDLKTAEGILEEDHYGLKDIKERVLEFLAVRKLREDMRGPILCFVGPPGTGKTSIGKSIARALGRKYIRISLGGVRDEAEIRGHRRTYIGALPGRIINGLKKAGSNNPVFMLDEVDKIGADFRGDPASALLEVLDPEQNFSYSDHYLDVPFDLSRVLFVATANILDPVPPALKDRMEVLEFPGYTEEEKLQIAKRYLLPEQMKEHGLESDQFQITDAAITKIIRQYTREAGVRNLERRLATMCRKAAKAIVLEERKDVTGDEEQVAELLGPPQFISEVAERVTEPGVATGLAWTPAGGDVLFVEVLRTPGDAKLILTGQMGDVMKESAQAALTYVQAHQDLFGFLPDMFGKSDFHVHVPAGAIPKDGPSAGITIATAIASLCSNRRVKHTVAMTGEITLRGKVLPVGGIKEKVLAAMRAGINTLVLPEQNRKDMADVPDYAKQKLDFVFVDKIEEAVRVALEDAAEQPSRAEEEPQTASSARPTA